MAKKKKKSKKIKFERPSSTLVAAGFGAACGVASIPLIQMYFPTTASRLIPGIPPPFDRNEILIPLVSGGVATFVSLISANPKLKAFLFSFGIVSVLSSLIKAFMEQPAARSSRYMGNSPRLRAMAVNSPRNRYAVAPGRIATGRSTVSTQPIRGRLNHSGQGPIDVRPPKAGLSNEPWSATSRGSLPIRPSKFKLFPTQKTVARTSYETVTKLEPKVIWS